MSMWWPYPRRAATAECASSCTQVASRRATCTVTSQRAKATNTAAQSGHVALATIAVCPVRNLGLGDAKAARNARSKRKDARDGSQIQPEGPE